MPGKSGNSWTKIESDTPYRDVYLAIWAAETQENYYLEALEILDASRLYDGGLIKMCIARYMRLNGNFEGVRWVMSSVEPCALGRVVRTHAYGVLEDRKAAISLLEEMQTAGMAPVVLASIDLAIGHLKNSKKMIEAALNTGDLPFADETYARRLLS